MTATENSAPPVSVNAGQLPGWPERVLLFGTGFGIAVNGQNLEAAIVRARPSGPTLIASTVINDFRSRPAAAWGAELAALLKDAHESRLAATLLLPREDVIVRLVPLPGVAARDVPAAIELQLDTLHPYGDAEVVWAWGPAGKGSVMVGLVRKEILSRYETLFAEAGIAIAAVTFSSAAIHSAVRLWTVAPASLLFYFADARGRTEVYGESESRAVFSGEFPFARERALAIARGELRLGADAAARALHEGLPVPVDGAAASLPVMMAYVAALAGSVSHARRFANLLPPERRASHDRVQFLLPALLALLTVLTLLTVLVILPAVEQRRYRNELTAAAKALEPAAARTQTINRTVTQDRARIAALDDLRRRPQADLDVLNELTRLLTPDIWTNTIEIYPDSVVIAGEAPQAAPLLRLLDSSPLFQNSEFVVGVARTPQQNEIFRIRTMRRGRIGRVTP